MKTAFRYLLTLSFLAIITLGYAQDQTDFSKDEPQTFKRFSIYGGLLDNVDYFGYPRFNIQIQYAIKPWMAIEYDRRFVTDGHTNFGRLGLNFTLNPASEKKLKYYVGVLGAMTKHFYFDVPIGIRYPLGKGIHVKLGIRYFYMPDDYEPYRTLMPEIMIGIRF